MTDVQRWHVARGLGIEMTDDGGFHHILYSGDVYLAADYEALEARYERDVAAARRDEREQMIASVEDGTARIAGRPIGYVDGA